MGMVQVVAVVACALAALWFGVVVFRTKSMVRSALALLGSMVALGALFLALTVEFLGVLQLMMMATEMAVMAAFMVMYMMDPGGLGQMEMTHQKPVAAAAGVLAAVGVVALVLLSPWGAAVVMPPTPAQQVHDLGVELMRRSMLIFETAGTSILLAMVAATAVGVARRAQS